MGDGVLGAQSARDLTKPDTSDILLCRVLDKGSAVL